MTDRSHPTTKHAGVIRGSSLVVALVLVFWTFVVVVGVGISLLYGSISSSADAQRGWWHLVMSIPAAAGVIAVEAGLIVLLGCLTAWRLLARRRSSEDDPF